jgi:outer membrane protein assembly factor BamB
MANSPRSVKTMSCIIVPLAVLWAATQPAGAQELLWTNMDNPGGGSTDYATITHDPPRDMEIGDDFFVQGQVESVVVEDAGGDFPINGAYVRFYERTANGPGALQAEYFFAAGDPGFEFNPGNGVYTVFTLPAPFQADGWHVVSFQVEYQTYAQWWLNCANYANVEGDMYWQNDRLAGTGWEPGKTVFGQSRTPVDLSIALYGTAGTASPVIASISPDTLPRSGRLLIEGMNLGAGTGNSEVLIDGTPGLISRWMDTLIAVYVPETAGPGVVDVQVIVDGQATAPLPITVTLREQQGVVRWRFPVDGRYMGHRPGIAPDGTVYLSDSGGKLWALSPDGALLWMVDALRGQVGNGAEGPVAVGADGTVYVGVNPLGSTVELAAFNPDGSMRWVYVVPSALSYQAGPNVGPDGNVYAVFANGGDHAAISLSPDGQLRWNVAADPVLFEDAPVGADLVFAPSQSGGPIDQLVVFADRNGDARIYAFAMADGNQQFAAAVTESSAVFQQFQGQVAANPDSGDVYYTEFSGLGGAGWYLQQFDADGSRGWSFDPDIASECSAPDVGGDGTIYFSWDTSRLSAVRPDGTERWRVTDTSSIMLQGPIASPTDELLAMGGRIAFGQPGWIRGFSTADGQELFRVDLPSENGFSVVPDSRAQFTEDGATAYFSCNLAISGPTEYCYLYAIETGTGAIPGDINGDGAVDIQDLGALLPAYGTCNGDPNYNPEADFDNSGCVDISDLGTLLANYGVGA